MSLVNAASNNIAYTNNAKNLAITNDLTTGNILFSSERHNIPPQVLGTLVAEEDPRSSDSVPRIRIKRMNDDGTLDRYLLRRKRAYMLFCYGEGDQAPQRISTADNRANMIIEVLAYLNNLFTEVPATTSTILDFGPDDTLDGARDATNTTVLFDNGKEHAVNAILAVKNDLDLINVVDHATQQIHFRNIRHDKVTITGSSAGNDVDGVVNALNALFTVNPLGAGYTPTQVLPTLAADAVSLNLADELVPVTTDPVTGNAHIIATNADSLHGSRAWSNEFIDETGEFIDFKITGKGAFLLGAYEIGVDEAALAEGTTGNLDNGCYWGVSLNDTQPGGLIFPQGVYGSNSAFVYGAGWNGDLSSQYTTNSEVQDNHVNGYSNLWRLSISATGYLSLSYYDAGRTNSFILVARRSQQHPAGVKLGLLIKCVTGNSTLASLPLRTATDPSGPAMSFRYIESPDGVFSYPLFATEEEATYYDQNHDGTQGTGTAHTHSYVDEPTAAVWYMPDTGRIMNGATLPQDALHTSFQGAAVSYTEIPTLSDDQFAPAAFTLDPVTADENTAINIALHPLGSSPSSYTTTVDSSQLPTGIVNSGAQNRYLQGTLPHVGSDTSYYIDVTRTNAYGSTVAQQVITIADNAAASAIAGWTVHQGNTVSPNLISNSEHSVLVYDTDITQGTRIRIPYEQFMKFGFLKGAGVLNQDTLDIFNPVVDQNYFEVIFTIWSAPNQFRVNHSNHSGYGWTYNGATNQPAAQSDDVYFLDYKNDGYIELINSATGEILLTSANAYTGSLTLATGTPHSYVTDTIVPAITTEDLTYFGDPVAGFTYDATSVNLENASTLGDGSVVSIDGGLDEVHRLVIRKEWIEANILPALGSASGTSQVFVGIPSASADWQNLTSGNGNVAAEDFDLAFGFAMADDYRASGWKLKFYKQGAQTRNVLINNPTNGLYDLVLDNDMGDLTLQAGTDATTGDQTTEPTAANGGSWNMNTNFMGNASDSRQIVIGAQNCNPTLANSGLETHRVPFGPRTMLIGESNSGNGQFGIVTSDKYGTGTSGHSHADLDFNPPSISAGQTWTFIYDSSVESGDYVEYSRPDQSDAVYNTGISLFDNTATGGYRGFTWVVPQDVPPLRVRYYNTYNTGSFDSYRDQPISGSTYYVPITGATLDGPSSAVTGNTVSNDAWYSVNETVAPGERMIINGTVLRSMFELIDSDPGTQIQFNARDVNDWTENAAANASGLHDKWVRLRVHGGQYHITLFWGSASVGNLYLNTLSEVEDTVVFYNLVGSGNAVRHGMINDSQAESLANSVSFSDWTGPKDQTQDQGYGLTEMTMGFRILPATSVDISLIDWSSIYDIVAPVTPPAPMTDFVRALNFSGGSEHAQQVSNTDVHSPLRLGGVQASTDSDTQRGPGGTMAELHTRPWAVACVFRIDGNASNQIIWNQGEGAGSSDDNIYLRLDANKKLYFGWGRDGLLNELYLGFTASQYHWIGVYVANNGTRLGQSMSTAANLAPGFDVRWMGSATGTGSTWMGQFTTLSANASTEFMWNHSGSTTGGRNQMRVEGEFTIGGRGSNRSFHGKIASCVVTTLRNGVNMPDEAEIKMMITDPMMWRQDYKIGQVYRQPDENGNTLNFQTGFEEAQSTQIWLMGDGNSDGYAQIMNQVDVANSNSRLNMISMVSNDIETVNINGLS